MFNKSSNKREKVDSTAFSEFVRNASAKEKKKFFAQVVQETIVEQKAIIDKANHMQNCPA